MRPVIPIAAIFDVEGTLIDCVAFQLESWRVTLNEAGYSFTHRDLQPFSGMDGLWMLDQLLPKESHDCNKRLLQAQGESYRRDFLQCAQAFPQVRSLFEALKQREALTGIATTCQKDELAPSLFRFCLTQLQVADAACTIAIGDTPYDAEAAGQLGMRSVGVLTGGFSEGTLREAGCEGVFPQVKDVAALWQNGPTRLR